MRAVRPMRSAACLISGEVATITVVSGCTRRPSRAPATASISNNDSCGAAKTTTSSLSPGASKRARKAAELGGADRNGCRRRPGEHGLLGGDAGHVKERHRPEACQGRTEMLQRVRTRDRFQPLDDRNLPVGAARLADEGA